MIEVIKNTGEIEPLKEEKILTTIAKVGGSYELGKEIFNSIIKKLPERITTERLYKIIFDELRKRHPIYSLKLNLKKAIFNLGPTGYPFEKYFARLLEYYGYDVELNLIMEGRCVHHEIDIKAKKDDKEYLIECKFHNVWDKKSDVQVVLYTYARVLDINEKEGKTFIPWVVTNTKLSLDAINYGECQGMKLTAWRYPFNESLEILIEKSKRYPITILISGNQKIFHNLINENIILLEEFVSLNKNEIRKITGASMQLVENLLTEAELLLYQ